MMSARAAARAAVASDTDVLIDLSHRIHANPEVAFEEAHASTWLGELLTASGFDVTPGVAGLPTAFTATRGDGPLRIGICAEYDALPGIGHACGHNIIAAAAVGAGLALARVADELGITVTVFGTPAEEGGAGKILMLDAGVFDGTHAAMMVHPSPTDVVRMPMIAASHFTVRYHGRAAHAAASPEFGINANDAMVIAQTAIALQRQQMRSTDRVHGVVSRGGDAPNIIPAETEAWYITRASKLADLDELSERIRRCFQAGALASGATLDLEPTTAPYAECRHDPLLVAAYCRALDDLARPYHLDPIESGQIGGSTDMGNVSHRIPSIHPALGIETDGSVNHQPEFAAACATPSADRAVIDGAAALALTAIDVATDPQARGRLLTPGAGG